MRTLHHPAVQVATRGTSREINRSIALNLVRTRQPLSRADLARLMGLRRGAVSVLVNELIEDGLVFEGAKGEAARGRKPKFLYIDSRNRCVLAVDIRPSRTFLMVTDLVCQPLVGVDSFPTPREPRKLVAELARHARRILREHPELGTCEGLGVVVPGMVDREGERVLFAPRLGWRDVPLRGPLAAATGLGVHIENSGKACALSQMWAAPGHTPAGGDAVFVNVSDGVGVGVIVEGALLRGRHNVAGEFAHIPLSIDGPRCACGAAGCWEAYVSNLATLSRYFGRPLVTDRPLPAEFATLTVDDLVVRARGGDARALAALQSTARYLGLGLASVVNVMDPARISIGGEITRAWDLIEGTVRTALQERALSPLLGEVEITVVPAEAYPRLRGAAALVAAPVLAARAAA